MSAYFAPLRDMQFVLRELVGLEVWPGCRGWKKTHRIWSTPYWKKQPKLACEVLAPLNKQGDTQGCKLKDHAVTTPDGLKQAYGNSSTAAGPCWPAILTMADKDCQRWWLLRWRRCGTPPTWALRCARC